MQSRFGAEAHSVLPINIKPPCITVAVILSTWIHTSQRYAIIQLQSTVVFETPGSARHSRQSGTRPQLRTGGAVPGQVKSFAGLDGAPAAEWGEFLHLKGQRFHEDDKIREEIQGETDRLTGTNRGISDRPIRLKITSPHVLCAPPLPPPPPLR